MRKKYSRLKIFRTVERDWEIAEWLQKNMHLGSLDQIRSACAVVFGIARTPSRTSIARYLQSEGRRVRLGDRNFFGTQTQVSEWIRGNHHGKTLDRICTECLARFGIKPSRSAVSRFLRKFSDARRPREMLVAKDKDVASFLCEHAMHMSMVDLLRACVARFGAERTPSRSAVHRFLYRQPGPKLTRRKSTLDRNPEVAQWLQEQDDDCTLDELRQAALLRFGRKQTPSRSAIHRYRVAARRK